MNKTQLTGIALMTIIQQAMLFNLNLEPFNYITLSIGLVIFNVIVFYEKKGN